MCGICGVIGGQAPAVAVEAMLDRLRHRGPNARKSWSDGYAAVGHTRLAIVDLSPRGNQPMFGEDRRVILVANGEIYNSPELRQSLIAQGHCFASESDNEVLLHLLEEAGEDGFRRINGMFACGIWDCKRRRLVLARDRLGIKPLYYTQLGKVFLFASEIKALLTYPGACRGIDPLGLRQYLTYENTLGATTLHREIKMVEPGECLVFEAGEIRRHPFWEARLPENAPETSFQDACEAYRHSAERSVKRHLMSDVPVASYLSSGIDSTSVATLAAEQMGRPIATFTGGFSVGGWYDETTGAEAVARRIGSRHRCVSIGANDLCEVMDDLIYALDEPRMGPGAFSQYMVAREAAKDVKVILTGHGGDELFGGYPVFKVIKYFQMLRSNPAEGMAMLWRVRLAEWPHFVYFAMARARAPEARNFLPVIFPRRWLQRHLRTEVAGRLRSCAPDGVLNTMVAGNQDPYRRLMLTYLRAYLPGLFVVEDKISMAHSLESRTPLCDNAMLDLGLSLSLDVKLTGGTLKSVPKTAMRPRLPSVLYQVPKRGFPTPLAKWFRGELRGWLWDRLTARSSPLNDLFQPDHLRRTVQSYVNSIYRHVRPLDEIQTHRMWALLSLDAWLRVTKERLGISLTLN